MPDAPNKIPWPPLLFVAGAIIGLALHWIYPLPWVQGTPRSLLVIAGSAIICAGLALEIASALAFRRHRTTILPHRPASRLITDGPYAISRNPIYLGNTALLAGAGLVFGVGWLIPLSLAAAYSVKKLAIEREERHLAVLFGNDWKRYAARTGRWLSAPGLPK